MSELTIKDKLRGIDYLITVKVQNNPVGFDGAVIDARLRLKEESVDRIMQLIESAITEAENRGELELAEEMLSWDCVLNDKLTLSRVMERVDYLHSELKDNTSEEITEKEE